MSPDEGLMSRWNDVMPWTVDYGVNVVRDRMQEAVAKQRTT